MGFRKTFQKKAVMNLLMAAGSLAICIAVALVSLMPQTYDIVSGEISDITITAPADVVDQAATQRVIEEEQAKVGPVYKNDANTTQQIVKKISEDFVAFEEARAGAEERYSAEQEAKRQEVEKEIAAAEQANAANPTQPVPVPTA